MIYFVRDGDFVKIGHVSTSLRRSSWISDVRTRVVGLNAGNPRELEILGVIDGDKYREARLHAIFANDHYRGEWFRIGERLMRFINANAYSVQVSVTKIGFRRHYSAPQKLSAKTVS